MNKCSWNWFLWICMWVRHSTNISELTLCTTQACRFKDKESCSALGSFWTCWTTPFSNHSLVLSSAEEESKWEQQWNFTTVSLPFISVIYIFTFNGNHPACLYPRFSEKYGILLFFLIIISFISFCFGHKRPWVLFSLLKLWVTTRWQCNQINWTEGELKLSRDRQNKDNTSDTTELNIQPQRGVMRSKYCNTWYFRIIHTEVTASN